MMFTKNVNERGKSVNKFRGALLNRNYWNNGKCSIQMPKCSGSEGKTITKAKIDKQIEFVKILQLKSSLFSKDKGLSLKIKL